MKRLTMIAALLMVVSMFASCKHKADSFNDFVGIWGVKQIDYYNIDYAGNPIEATREVYYFTPGDMESGIDLVFRADQTGEMRDRSTDTIVTKNESTTPITYDTIICPDTTLYTYFDYSYDADEAILYMNMETEQTVHTYKMRITNFDKDSYTYVSEYRKNYIEEAQMVRYSDVVKSPAGLTYTKRPNKKGSILGKR